MKLMTRFELAALGTDELHALWREVLNALVRSAPGSDDRRICIASLENISAELLTRPGP